MLSHKLLLSEKQQISKMDLVVYHSLFDRLSFCLSFFSFTKTVLIQPNQIANGENNAIPRFSKINIMLLLLLQLVSVQEAFYQEPCGHFKASCIFYYVGKLFGKLVGFSYIYSSFFVLIHFSGCIYR